MWECITLSANVSVMLLPAAPRSCQTGSSRVRKSGTKFVSH